jgi:hypothetical protein
MMACASCPFTTDDETLTACPQCKQVLTPAPSPDEIAKRLPRSGPAGRDGNRRCGSPTLSNPWR